MKRFRQIIATVAFSAMFAISATSQALEQSDPPLIRDTGGAGPGAGDPSLGGTRMPPSGDKAGVDAAERAEKIAERKAREAERRKEEERKRKAAQLAPPMVRAASTPVPTTTTATSRRATLAPSALSR